jgi:hypothetical protein
LQQLRRIDLPGRRQITAEEEFDVPEVEMIIGIVTFRANRQKKLLRCRADAAHPEVRAAQRVGRFPILWLEPLGCLPMFDRCFRLPVFAEKCGKGVLRRDRLRMVPDELVLDLLHTQTLFYRHVGIRERLRCLMGRSDFYPRFYPCTDGFRTREHRRKEQNGQRGGSPLAFTPVAPRAVADYQSRRSSWRDHLHMQKIGFAEALDSIVATHNCYSREAYVFLRDALDYTTKQQKKTIRIRRLCVYQLLAVRKHIAVLPAERTDWPMSAAVHLTVRSSISKDGKLAHQPLPPSVAAALRQGCLVDVAPTDLVFGKISRPPVFRTWMGKGNTPISTRSEQRTGRFSCLGRPEFMRMQLIRRSALS